MTVYRASYLRPTERYIRALRVGGEPGARRALDAITADVVAISHPIDPFDYRQPRLPMAPPTAYQAAIGPPVDPWADAA